MTFIKSAIPPLTGAVITCWDETCFLLLLEPFCDYIFKMGKNKEGKTFHKQMRPPFTDLLQADSLSLTNSHISALPLIKQHSYFLNMETEME